MFALKESSIYSEMIVPKKSANIYNLHYTCKYFFAITIPLCLVANVSADLRSAPVSVVATLLKTHTQLSVEKRRPAIKLYEHVKVDTYLMFHVVNADTKFT